jgi:hypothetical protein
VDQSTIYLTGAKMPQGPNPRGNRRHARRPVSNQSNALVVMVPALPDTPNFSLHIESILILSTQVCGL